MAGIWGNYNQVLAKNRAFFRRSGQGNVRQTPGAERGTAALSGVAEEPRSPSRKSGFPI